nr:transcription activator protein [Cotton leaf curl Burewala virus]
MQSSSLWKDRCTQLPIKVQHMEPIRLNRRMSVYLECGCSYYLSINCHNHGFTHRGTHHCSSSREWRIYLGSSKSPLFQDHQPRQPSIHDEYGYTHDQDPVQSQPEESVGDTQMFHSFPNLDDLTASDWSFLKGL